MPRTDTYRNQNGIPGGISDENLRRNFLEISVETTGRFEDKTWEIPKEAYHRTAKGNQAKSYKIT